MPESSAGPSEKGKNSRGLKGRDLITVGIFTALYFAVTMIPMLLSGLHPLLWVLFPGLAAILAGIPFMLLCARVQKPFAVLIMGALMALLFATGGPIPLIVALFVGSATIAEIIRRATGYNSLWGNGAAFAFFSLGWLCSPLPMWLFHDSFMQRISQMGMPADYVAACESVASPLFLVVCVGFTVIGAFLGVLIARALLKRHFEKAGLA